jgi:outer membrane protein OmpA-like peptidoglycan-associated protein
MQSLEPKNNVTHSVAQRKSFFGGGAQPAFFGGPVLPFQPFGNRARFKTNQFVNGNFPNFNAQYDVNGPAPRVGTLFITHGVHMKYPPAMDKSERSTFETDFKKSVHDIWSKQHPLGLIEPGFAPYVCEVDVNTTVEDDPKNAHTVIQVVKPKGEKRHRSVVTTIDKVKDSKTTHTAKLDYRDPTVEETKAIDEADMIKQVGPFDFDSDQINAECQEDIDEIRAFISTIPGANDEGADAFNLQLVGRASSEGSVAYNKKLSQRRIDSVQQALQFPGLGISTTEDAGEDEATEDAAFRRVNVGVFIEKPKEKSTSQNVAAHEFGHMIGLGDEYVDTTNKDPNIRKKYFGDNPTHYGAIKEMMDEETADQHLIQDSKSIMSAGNNVQRGHYVIFAAAISRMTAPEVEAATGKKDAKWIVF